MTEPTDSEKIDTSIDVDQVLDVSGLRCPMPLLKTKLALSCLEAGRRLLVVATDAGSARDIPAFLQLSDHRLIKAEQVDESFRFFIERG